MNVRDLAYFSYAISSEIPGITNAEFMRAAINAKRDENDKISRYGIFEKVR